MIRDEEEASDEEKSPKTSVNGGIYSSGIGEDQEEEGREIEVEPERDGRTDAYVRD